MFGREGESESPCSKCLYAKYLEPKTVLIRNQLIFVKSFKKLRFFLALFFLNFIFNGCGSGDSETVQKREQGDESDGDSKSDPDPVTDDNTSNNNQIDTDGFENSSFPAFRSDINPLTFAAEGGLELVADRLLASSDNGYIKLITDGRESLKDECLFPIPPQGIAIADHIDIDGDLSDWPANSIVGIDRMGDGVSGSKSFDLRSLLWTKNSEGYFLAVEFWDRWPLQNQGNEYLALMFSKIEMAEPLNMTSGPSSKHKWGLAIFSSDIYELNDDVFEILDLSKSEHQEKGIEYKINGTIIEIKFSKSYVDSLMANGTFSLDVFTEKQGSDADHVGPILEGFTSDYSCLVPVADADLNYSGFQMLHMKRAGNVIEEVAETIYRSMAQVAAYGHFLNRNELTYWDTNNVIAIEAMNTAGLYIQNIGHFIEDSPNNFANEIGLTENLVFTAAHEYMHSYNVSQYSFAANWLREGHSNKFAREFIKEFYGFGQAQRFLTYDLLSYLAEEKKLGTGKTHTVGDDNWNQADHTALFFYRKSAAYLDLLFQSVDYDELVAGVFEKSGVQNLATDKFLDQVANLSSFSGDREDLSTYWFASGSSQGVGSTNLLSDADGDGLFDFQENQHNTSSSNPDSDQDGVSDLMELALESDPLMSENHGFITPDNLLTDWTNVFGDDVFRTSPDLTGTSSVCGNFSNIVSYQVLYDGPWYVVAAELGDIPQDSNFMVVVFITGIDGNPQVIAPFQSNFYMLKNADGSLIRSFQNLAPFNNKILEFPIHESWFGKDFTKENLKFRLVTFQGNAQCDYTDNIPPMQP